MKIDTKIIKKPIAFLFSFLLAACGDDDLSFSVHDGSESLSVDLGSDSFDELSEVGQASLVQVSIDQVAPNRERGVLTVPLDEGDQDQEDPETIDLAFIRISQSPDAEPIVVHFGGPGSSAVNSLGDFVSRLPRGFQERYAFIGLDDIGVGDSPRLNCSDVSVSPAFNHAFATAPDSELEEFGENFAASCAESPVFNEVGTARYARDIDRLREALGYERLNILGFSYGTNVALHYAALFPDRVGRIVLDSPTDPRAGFVELTSLQTQAFSSAFDSFLSWCEEQSNCSIDIDRLNLIIDTLASRTDPFAVNSARLLSSAISRRLRFEPSWPILAQLLQPVIAQPFRIALLPEPPPIGIATESFVGKSCTDQPIEDTAEIFGAIADFDESFDGELSLNYFSNNFDIAFACAFWDSDAELVSWDAVLPQLQNVDSILTINALGDTQTPRELTEGLVDAIPDLSVITVDEVSHSVSFSGVNPCLQNAVITFFNEGTVSVTECDKSAFPLTNRSSGQGPVFSAEEPLPWELLLSQER